MGNGPRLKPPGIVFDTETSGKTIVSGSPLTEDDLEKMVASVTASFGKANQIFMAPNVFMSMGGGWEQYPEYSGTPWANTSKMTKREKAVAGLHTTLNKIEALKKLSSQDWENIRYASIRRLKRAKWARYQQKKVQSSP